MQLSKYEEQLSQNPSYTPEMVNQEIQNKFELMLTGVEDNIYQMNNVKKEDVNKASDMLQNDRDFKRATYRLRSMFAVMQGQTPEPPDVSVVGMVHPQLPEFMTLSYTLEVMKEVMSKAAEVMADVVKTEKEKAGIEDMEEFKKQVGQNEEIQKAVFETYMTNLDVKRTEILEKYHIDKAVRVAVRDDA